jgi:hypothetical protein
MVTTDSEHERKIITNYIKQNKPNEQTLQAFLQGQPRELKALMNSRGPEAKSSSE